MKRAALSALLVPVLLSGCYRVEKPAATSGPVTAPSRGCRAFLFEPTQAASAVGTAGSSIRSIRRIGAVGMIHFRPNFCPAMSPRSIASTTLGRERPRSRAA